MLPLANSSCLSSSLLAPYLDCYVVVFLSVICRFSCIACSFTVSPMICIRCLHACHYTLPVYFMSSSFLLFCCVQFLLLGPACLLLFSRLPACLPAVVLSFACQPLFSRLPACRCSRVCLPAAVLAFLPACLPLFSRFCLPACRCSPVSGCLPAVVLPARLPLLSRFCLPACRCSPVSGYLPAVVLAVSAVLAVR